MHHIQSQTTAPVPNNHAATHSRRVSQLRGGIGMGEYCGSSFISDVISRAKASCRDMTKNGNRKPYNENSAWEYHIVGNGK